MKRLILIGGGTNLLCCKEIAEDLGFYIVGVIDSIAKIGTTLHGLTVLGQQSDIKEISEEHDARFVAITIGDNYIRYKIHKQVLELHSKLQFPNLIHSSVVVSKYAKLGKGIVAMPGCIFMPGSKIGNFSLFLTGAQVEHDCIIGDYASVSAGSIMGGRVKIGKFSALTLGVVVFDRLSIGENVVVGSNSLVTHDLPDNVLAYGSPAKIIRGRKLGEKFLK